MAKARYLALYAETTPGTFPGSPTAIPIRLIGDTAFDLEPMPQFADIRSHETANRVYAVESTRYVLKSKLSTYLYPGQASTLIDWATSLDSNLELSSMSSQYFDGVTYKQRLGLYVEQLVISASAEQEEGLVKADFDIVAIKPGTAITSGDFAAPAASTYPATNPFKLIESIGGLVVVDTGSTARTKYRSINLTIKNDLSPNWDEDQYVSDITWHGRTITLEADVRYTSGADRTLFEGKTPMKAWLQFVKTLTGGAPNTHTLKLDMLTKNIIDGLDKQLPLAKPGYQKLKVRSVLDPTSGTGNDFTKTYTFA